MVRRMVPVASWDVSPGCNFSAGRDGQRERDIVTVVHMAERSQRPDHPPAGRLACGGCGAVLPPRARFCSECGLRQGPNARAPRAVAPRSRELRPMTVLFCDVVDSSALAARADPEEFTETIAQFYRMITEVVARHGGHLGRLVGDGVLVYFGYPAAQEDDAERALRAAL